jgi:chromosome partitioning protein
MIILIGNIKGGVGKSTLSTNLAALLVQQGKDVVIVDADRQSTTANWTADRNTTEKPKVHCVRQYDSIRETLQDLSNRYDVVIADCQGRDSLELRSGMLVANRLIVPFKPSQPDLDTLPTISNIIKDSKLINPTMQALGLLTIAPTNPSITEISDSLKFAKNYAEIKMLETIIFDRKVYRDAISLGLGVIEMDNDKAKQEIENLLLEVLNG